MSSTDGRTDGQTGQGEPNPRPPTSLGKGIKIFFIQSNSHRNLLEKICQKLDRHTVGKWLIHGTKRHKDNPSQNLKTCRILDLDYSWLECKPNQKEFHGNEFNPVSY